MVLTKSDPFTENLSREFLAPHKELYESVPYTQGAGQPWPAQNRMRMYAPAGTDLFQEMVRHRLPQLSTVWPGEK
jgi:hypothetical protein